MKLSGLGKLDIHDTLPNQCADLLEMAGNRLIDMEKNAKKVKAESQKEPDRLVRKHPSWDNAYLQDLTQTMIAMQAYFEESKTAEQRRMEVLSQAFPLIKQYVESHTTERLALDCPPVPTELTEFPKYLKKMVCHMDTVKTILQAEQDLLKFKEIVSNQSVIQRLDNQDGYNSWLVSLEGVMAEHAALYNAYNNCLENFKHQCVSRIMELDKSNVRGTNTAIRWKIAIGANRQCWMLQASYQQYLDALKALPDTL